MKEINQVLYMVLALLWLVITMTYAIKGDNKETPFLAFIISLQYQNMLHQSIDHEKNNRKEIYNNEKI